MILRPVGEACMNFYELTGKDSLNEFFFQSKREKNEWLFISGRQKCTSIFPSPCKHSWWQFPIGNRLMTRPFPPKNHGNVRQNWGYVLKSEPQTFRQSLNFYQYHSTSTIQQAGGKISREKTRLSSLAPSRQSSHVYIIYCSTITLVSASRLD